MKLNEKSIFLWGFALTSKVAGLASIFRSGAAEGGCGGNSAAPSLSAPTGFIFCEAKSTARKYGVVFAPPSRAHTTNFLLPKTDVE